MSNIQAILGDITRFPADVIVNAANEALIGGGGVDGAIHRAAGPGLLVECQKLQWCDIGDAKLTEAYLLPARHVIHTVGPVWEGGAYGEAELLAQCYRRTLALARQQGARTITFPAISCGTFGYPVDLACRIAVAEVRRCLEVNPDLEQVTFVCFDEEILEEYQAALAEVGS